MKTATFCLIISLLSTPAFSQLSIPPHDPFRSGTYGGYGVPNNSGLNESAKRSGKMSPGDYAEQFPHRSGNYPGLSNQRQKPRPGCEFRYQGYQLYELCR